VVIKGKKTLKYILVTGAFVATAYFLPIPLIILILCGVWDVSRNKGLNADVFRQYFLKNGLGTWVASPLNIGMDILALPYRNKGVYELADLPATYQEEIRGLINATDSAALAKRFMGYIDGESRAMVFFKWYGRNIKTPFEWPEFHKDYKFIRTIGVSAFKEHESTSRHFGPFRASLRVLYCLDENLAEGAYIKVGPVENHWSDKRLFIFDDTLLHQSFNETDKPRSCLFVDVIRPSYLPFVFDAAMTAIRIAFNGMNGVFYKNWKLINN
jgi:beta-hydroxylase